MRKQKQTYAVIPSPAVITILDHGDGQIEILLSEGLEYGEIATILDNVMQELKKNILPEKQEDLSSESHDDATTDGR